MLGPWTGVQCGKAHSPPNAPLTPTLLIDPPNAPTPLPAPMSPTPLPAPDAPTPLLAQFFLTPPYPCWPPEPLHPCQSQCTLTSLHPASGSSGTLDWAQCGWAPSPPTTPVSHDIPYTSYKPQMPPTPQCPMMPLHPCWLECLLTPLTPAGPCTPAIPQTTPDTPIPLHPCQWECWDLDWGQMWLGSQSTYHPHVP